MQILMDFQCYNGIWQKLIFIMLSLLLTTVAYSCADCDYFLEN